MSALCPSSRLGYWSTIPFSAKQFGLVMCTLCTEQEEHSKRFSCLLRRHTCRANARTRRLFPWHAFSSWQRDFRVLGVKWGWVCSWGWASGQSFDRRSLWPDSEVHLVRIGTLSSLLGSQALRCYFAFYRMTGKKRQGKQGCCWFNKKRNLV